MATANNNNNAEESNIALGKKLKIEPIDEKTLKSILSGIGKEKRKPGSGLLGNKGSKRAGPVFELCNLPLEEKEITCDSFDEQIRKCLLKDSVVSVGDKVFVADRLTGVPCPHYYFSIPSSATLNDIGNAINRGNKGKQQRLHGIAGRLDGFHGSFATLENLFTYLHCVLSISASSPIFRDLLKLFHIDDSQMKSFSSEKLHKNYLAVCASKVFGGNSNLIVPAQAARQTKSLKSPGCFFYSSDNENPFGFSTVKHTILCKRYNVPTGLSFPDYADWEATLANSKNSRSRTLENHNQWKEFAETYGEEATKSLFAKLAEKKKLEGRQKRRRAAMDEDSVELEDGDGIIAYGEGFNFKALGIKKPRLQDAETDDDDDDSSSNGDITVLEEGVSTIHDDQEEQESDRLIQEFLDSMRTELNNETQRNPRYSDWGDDGQFLDIAEEIDWRGVDFVDDSSRHYKKNVRKIHSLLKNKKK